MAIDARTGNDGFDAGWNLGRCFERVAGILRRVGKVRAEKLANNKCDGQNDHNDHQYLFQHGAQPFSKYLTHNRILARCFFRQQLLLSRFLRP